MASEFCRRNRSGSVTLLWMGVTAALLTLPQNARAANTCPWMNEATASGFLDDNAVGEMTPQQPGQPAACTFVEQGAGGVRTLRITVEQMKDAAMKYAALAQSCKPDAAPMKAIGNEAVECAADDRKLGRGERAVGRVRDQVFTVSISTTVKNDAMLSGDALKTRIYSAAEEVAGSLF